MIRTLLFVPGDSPRKFARAIECPADALILDLEDSVAPGQKVVARGVTADLLRTPVRTQALYVRVNALDTGLLVDDLAAVMPARPDGIVLPKCRSGDDLRRVHHYLDAFEAAFGLQAGSTRLLPIVTETADSLFGLAGYANASSRLWGMMWGAEDLSAALGAFGNQVDGQFTGPFLMARNQCLVAARAAGVEPVDTVYVDVKNLDGLRREALAARHDGFTAKALIHPSHVDVVNKAFMPTHAEVDWARRVMALVAGSPAGGVFVLDGRMVDLPHIRKAKGILEMAGVSG